MILSPTTWYKIELLDNKATAAGNDLPLVLPASLADGFSFKTGTNPLVTSPTSDGGEGVSQILDFSLKFDQNMDYSSLRDSVFRLSRTNASGVTLTGSENTFDISLAAAIDNPDANPLLAGLSVKFLSDPANANSVTTSDNVRRLEVSSTSFRLQEDSWYRVELLDS